MGKEIATIYRGKKKVVDTEQFDATGLESGVFLYTEAWDFYPNQKDGRSKAVKFN